MRILILTSAIMFAHTAVQACELRNTISSGPVAEATGSSLSPCLMLARDSSSGLHQIVSPEPLVRQDAAAVREMKDLIEQGEIQVEHQIGAPGAAVGAVFGFTAGGAGYLLAHGLNDHQGASLQGFMVASLGGAFLGAISGGSGTYTVIFLGTAMSVAIEFGTAWVDSIYQEMDQVVGR